jgi:hypothetical protein
MPRLHCNNNTTYYHELLVTYVFCMCPTVQYVLLSHDLITISFMSLAPCYVPINCYVFFQSFVSCLFVFCFIRTAFCFVCSAFLYCFSHVYSCLVSTCVQFSDRCHWLEAQLQLINIISYHYVTLHC